MAKVEAEQLLKEDTFADAVKVEPANQLNLLSEVASGMSHPGVLSLSDSATQTTLQTSMVPAFEIYDLAQTKTIVGLDGAATVRPIGTSQFRPDSKVDEALQYYTVSQLLELPPKKLPHNFILQAEFGASPQAELDRFKSSYDKKYGVSLGWAAELSADTAKTNLAFSSEHSQRPGIAQVFDLPQPQPRLAASDKNSTCTKQVDQRIENERLGLPADASEASRSSRKTELLYKLDENIRPERANEILNARLYGLDESLTAEEITKQTNHPAHKRWIEVLQIAPDSSTEQILQAQRKQKEEYAAGLEGQAKKDAEQTMLTYWNAIALGLPNPEQATPEQVNPLISELHRQEDTIAMGLDPDTSLIDISYAQMIRQMGLSPDTSREDIERIRRARELRLPDEASIEEVNELEANWNQRKEQLEQDCQN